MVWGALSFNNDNTDIYFYLTCPLKRLYHSAFPGPKGFPGIESSHLQVLVEHHMNPGVL